MIDIIIATVTILGILFYILFAISWIKDTKKQNRSAPNGKIFVKEFISIIDMLLHTQEFAKVESIWVNKGKMTFRVRIEEETKQHPLEYEFQQIYRSYIIYINDEPILREHIMYKNFKNEYYLEYSNKRDKLEVIDIITEAHKQSKDIRDARNKEINEKLGFTTKSFYNDTGDI